MPKFSLLSKNHYHRLVSVCLWCFTDTVCVCHRSAPTAPSSLASQSRPPPGPYSSPMRPVGLSAPDPDEDSRYATHTLTFSPLTSGLRAAKQLTFPQSPFLVYIISRDVFYLVASPFMFITSISILHTSRLKYQSFHSQLKVKAFR